MIMRIIGLCLAISLTPVVALGGSIDRIELSPGTMVNLASGHAGKFMGGSLGADLFFSKALAIRTTVGYTRDRYYPSDRDYSQSDYGLWLSLAPCTQFDLGNRVKPYLALLGTFSSGSNRHYSMHPLGTEQTPYARLQADARRNSAWSIGASVGTKVRLSGPIHVYGEVSHYFYSSISRGEVYFGPDSYLLGREFDFERNPTYATLGLSYSLDLTRK